jgi:hypothetical protein
VLDRDRHLLAARPGLLLIADKGYVSAELDTYLADRGAQLLRPSYRNRSLTRFSGHVGWSNHAAVSAAA